MNFEMRREHDGQTFPGLLPARGTVPQNKHAIVSGRVKITREIVPDDVETIDLDTVGAAIEAAGFEVGVRSRLCWTFSGRCEMTLYPSGKLMIRTEDKALAEDVANQHVSTWVKS